MDTHQKLGLVNMFLCVTTFSLGVLGATSDYAFPENFMLGAATSAYQSEGAWNENGKGQSIWDALTHARPEVISDASNGDVASGSYHRYKDDVQLAKELGIDFYRFSISWPRILPTGHVHIVNQAGINHYSNLINELKANGIEPVVTMYHWDLPQHLQELGGWANPVMADYFEDYAHVLFTNFGDRVKWWITINEPSNVALGYATQKLWAPNVNAPGIGDYMAMHTLLVAHANVYRLYDAKFRKTQQGKVGISLYSTWYDPLGNTPVNTAARDRAMQFELGSYGHPIFSVEGDFPAIVKERIARKSREEGFTRSRLPEFSAEEIKHIQGTFDFFGLNHFTTRVIKHEDKGGGDYDVEKSVDSSWASSALTWVKVVPTGFRKLLVWIKNEYGNPPLLVTGNGYADLDGLHDMERTKYYLSYMSEMMKAVKQDGCNVIGYTFWSLMDNFEWNQGYTERFGLYYVNFTDPSLRRIPKDSVYVFSDVARTRQLPRYLVDVISDVDSEDREEKQVVVAHGSQSTASTMGLPVCLYACVFLITCVIFKS